MRCFEAPLGKQSKREIKCCLCRMLKFGEWFVNNHPENKRMYLIKLFPLFKCLLLIFATAQEFISALFRARDKRELLCETNCRGRDYAAAVCTSQQVSNCFLSVLSSTQQKERYFTSNFGKWPTNESGEPQNKFTSNGAHFGPHAKSCGRNA